MSTVDYGLLERQMKAVTLAIQEELKEIDTIHRFSFTIEAEGRVDGDIKIGYRVGTDYESSVVAGTVSAALVEAMRRKGWTDSHSPKMISHVTGEVADDV